MQLTAAEGRVLLGGRVPEPAELPPDLGQALREWAEVAATVGRLGAPADRELVRRHGRQLAVRLARYRGVSVEYVDPVSGAIEPVPFAGQPQPYPRTERPPRSRPRPRPAPVAGRRSSSQTQPAAESTPWATGLTITATFAIVVAIADITLSRAFADALGLLWVPANVLVSAGIAPAVWLARRTPLWRWLAFGVAAGMVVAWAALLFGLLG